MTQNKFITFLQKIPRSYIFFGIFCLLFVALMLSVEINNDKFWTNDFKVYYDATNDFFNGKSPYLNPYGLDTGFFKYAPTTLYFFFFISKISYFTAQILHVFVLLLSLIIGITTLHKILFLQTNSKNKGFGILFLAFALIAIHLVREFHMGNVNLILFALFTLGLNASLKNREFQVALFWSLMVILKPIVILAFLPLLVFRLWKIIRWMVGFGALFFVIPILNKGFGSGLKLWNEWFTAIGLHGEYTVSENSFKYLANYYFGIHSIWIPSIIGLLFLVGIMLILQARNKFDKFDFVEWSALFLAFTPNFFVTDTEHFLLSLPLILVILKRLLEKRNMLFWVLFLLFILPFSLKSNDLLGESLSILANEKGMIGLANFALILFFCLISFASSTDANKLKANYTT